MKDEKLVQKTQYFRRDTVQKDQTSNNQDHETPGSAQAESVDIEYEIDPN